MTQGNAFKNCNTLEEMKFHWEILTSPENITCDGERPVSAQRDFLHNLAQDYRERYTAIST